MMWYWGQERIPLKEGTCKMSGHKFFLRVLRGYFYIIKLSQAVRIVSLLKEKIKIDWTKFFNFSKV